jgi:hypothetical protein
MGIEQYENTFNFSKYYIARLYKSGEKKILKYGRSIPTRAKWGWAIDRFSYLNYEFDTDDVYEFEYQGEKLKGTKHKVYRSGVESINKQWSAESLAKRVPEADEIVEIHVIGSKIFN